MEKATVSFCVSRKLVFSIKGYTKIKKLIQTRNTTDENTVIQTQQYLV